MTALRSESKHAVTAARYRVKVQQARQGLAYVMTHKQALEKEQAISTAIKGFTMPVSVRP